jgi:hypothetical protein
VDPSRIQAWSDTTPYFFDASGPGTDRITFDTGITVTVPAGKAYHYAVTYNGFFTYGILQRIGMSPNFFGSWAADLLANSTQVGPRFYVVATGYRMDWTTTGGSNYWVSVVHATWYIRLGPGTHTMKVRIAGGSDDTMNQASMRDQGFQILRID